MNTFQRKSIVLAVFGALAVAGCGGGSSSSTGSTTGAGVKHTGVITGFGSVFVNGVEYETGSSSVTLDGVVGKDSNLKIGMVVTVEGSVNKDGLHGTASSINYADELEGIVTAATIAADGTGTLTVMGQIVKIDAATVFESKVTSITTIGAVAAGNIVEISGYSLSTDTILATRVEVKKAALEAGDEIEVKGVIAGLDTTAKTFMLGSLMVHYGDAKVEHALADGLYVEVKSITAPVNGMLTASKVEVEGDGKKGVDGKSGDEFELEGVVSSVNSAKTEFVLDGQTVLVDSGTAFKNGSVDGIVVNAKLEVEGALNADGKLVADEIKFRHESSIEIEAGLDAVDATAGTVTVMGQTVIVNTLTIMIDKVGDVTVHDFSLSKLAVGNLVKLHIAVESGKLVATKLERDDHVASTDVTLEGPVTAISGTTQVTIAGIKVELSAFLNMTTVQVGDKLEITGEFANGVLTAKMAQKDS